MSSRARLELIDLLVHWAFWASKFTIFFPLERAFYRHKASPALLTGKLPIKRSKFELISSWHIAERTAGLSLTSLPGLRFSQHQSDWWWAANSVARKKNENPKHRPNEARKCLLNSSRSQITIESSLMIQFDYRWSRGVIRQKFAVDRMKKDCWKGENPWSQWTNILEWVAVRVNGNWLQSKKFRRERPECRNRRGNLIGMEK